MDNGKLQVFCGVRYGFRKGKSTKLMAAAIPHELSGGGYCFPFLLVQSKDI